MGKGFVELDEGNIVFYYLTESEIGNDFVEITIQDDQDQEKFERFFLSEEVLKNLVILRDSVISIVEDSIISFTFNLKNEPNFIFLNEVLNKGLELKKAEHSSFSFTISAVKDLIKMEYEKNGESLISSKIPKENLNTIFDYLIEKKEIEDSLPEEYKIRTKTFCFTQNGIFLQKPEPSTVPYNFIKKDLMIGISHFLDSVLNIEEDFQAVEEINFVENRIERKNDQIIINKSINISIDDVDLIIELIYTFWSETEGKSKACIKEEED